MQSYMDIFNALSQEHGSQIYCIMGIDFILKPLFPIEMINSELKSCWAWFKLFWSGIKYTEKDLVLGLKCYISLS